MTTSREINPQGRARLTAMSLAALLALGACAEGGAGSPGMGTIAGAAGAGTLAGVATRNRGPVTQTAAILGGALLGGMAGDRFIDAPKEQQRQAASETAQNRAIQRQLDYERQSAIQRAQVQQQIEEQRLFEQWRRERGI